jgi:ketosteroid isomerase-like protein
MNEHERVRVRELVERRMASFEAAERALDAQALVRHFSEADDFYMHNDGQRLTFETIAAAVREAFPTLRALDGGFTGVEVHVLAEDAALATARFHETITAKDGTVVRQRGAASWLWRVQEGEWKIVYGHVDHYPDPAFPGTT